MNEQEFDRLFRNKLNTLTHVPDVPWDDEVVWVKLEPVLKKSNNQKGYFLTILVLLLAGLSWWYVAKQQQSFSAPGSGINQTTAIAPKTTKPLLVRSPEAIQIKTPKQTQVLQKKPLAKEKQSVLFVEPIKTRQIKNDSTGTKEIVSYKVPPKLAVIKESESYPDQAKAARKLVVGINAGSDLEKSFIRPFSQKSNFYYGVGLKNTFTPTANSETTLLFQRPVVNLFVSYRRATPDKKVAFVIRSGTEHALPFFSGPRTVFNDPVWETQGALLIKLRENKQKTGGTFFFINTPPMRLHVKPLR